MQSNSLSERITLLRPILIFLIICTHIQGNLYRPDIKEIEFTIINFSHALLSGVIAVSALPLLSVISGYLAGLTYQKYGYKKTIVKKVYRILLPMIAWNFILALYIYSEQKSGIARRQDLILYPLNTDNLTNWIYGLLSLFKLPANQPLYFLKELFICFLAIPLLNIVSSKNWLFILFLIIISYLAISGINFGFFHRIDIYGFFLIGLSIYNRLFLYSWYKKLNTKKNRNILLIFFSIYCVLLCSYSLSSNREHFFIAMKILTLIGPLAFWVLSEFMPNKLKKFLIFISPASFGVFLGHILILNLYWDWWISYYRSTPITAGYWLFWCSSMLICFISMGAITYIYRKVIKTIKLAYIRIKQPN